jgi:hypothetical protein
MGTITLPDGLTLHIVSKVDAELEYHANSEHQVYFGNGTITINPGACSRSRWLCPPWAIYPCMHGLGLA